MIINSALEYGLGISKTYPQDPVAVLAVAIQKHRMAWARLRERLQEKQDQVCDLEGCEALEWMDDLELGFGLYR